MASIHVKLYIKNSYQLASTQLTVRRVRLSVNSYQLRERLDASISLFNCVLKVSVANVLTTVNF